MNKNDEQEIKKEFQLERIILFSDAVFAIIITIMVLDIRLPEGIKHADPSHVRHAFLELIPKAVAYALSFFLVARFWLGHLRIFSHLKDYDAKLLAHNLIYLFSVSLFPFAVTLVSGNISPESPAYNWGIYTYAAIILLTILSQTLLSHYIVVHRERLCFEPGRVAETLKYKVLRYNFITIPVAVVVLIIISSLGFPAYYSLGGLAVYGFIMGKLNRNHYPGQTGGPVIASLYNAIKNRRANKHVNKQLDVKE